MTITHHKSAVDITKHAIAPRILRLSRRVARPSRLIRGTRPAGSWPRARLPVPYRKFAGDFPVTYRRPRGAFQ